MNYVCDYSINFDEAKCMTVIFTVRQPVNSRISATKDFFFITEITPEGLVVDDNGDTYTNIKAGVRAVKAKLLIQYGINEEQIHLSGITTG